MHFWVEIGIYKCVLSVWILSDLPGMKMSFWRIDSYRPQNILFTLHIHVHILYIDVSCPSGLKPT